MEKYYLRSYPQPNGSYEVHRGSCNYLPAAGNRLYLGTFSNCMQALSAAKVYQNQVKGCKICCQDCYTI